MPSLRSLSRAVVSALLLTTSWAVPIEKRLQHLVEDIQFDKRQSSPFAVTGASGNGVQPRLEIRDLAANADQFNVFLLGLQKMQAVDQRDFLSYFQLAGIHGRPMVSWNGVQGNDNSPNPGYCTHVSNLFLTWHRPYLALYEQILQANAIDAANEFPAGPTRDRYVAAAQNLRLPYWDWAKTPAQGDNSIPAILTSETATVQTPNGSQTIHNPLYSYQFHPTDAGLYYQIYIDWQQTMRWPSSQDAGATTQNDQLISALNGNQQQYQQRLYNLLTQYNNFMDFTNEPFIKSAGPLQYDSLESLHDSVHSSVGGNNYGHMDVVDVSAFDPIFWLHHAMVDRSFALWQALYPDTYVEPQTQYQATYWYNQGSTQDINSQLLPFHSDGSGNFWTSATIRDLTVFGYTYPELQSGSRDSVAAAVNTLYGGSSSGAAKRSLLPGQFSTNMTNGTDDKPREYLTNIRAPKNALGGSYFVHVFLGDYSTNPADWPHDANLVGTYGVVAMKDADAMVPVTVSGVVPLTRALEKAHSEGKLHDLSDITVEEYLVKNLHWKIRTGDGTVVEPDKVPDFSLSVVSSEIQPAKSLTEFPKYVGKLTVHTDITHGRPGGVCETSEV